MAEGDAESVSGVGEAEGEAEVVVDRDALAYEIDRRGRAPHRDEDTGEIAQGAGLARPVAVRPESVDGLKEMGLACFGAVQAVRGDSQLVGCVAAGPRIVGQLVQGGGLLGLQTRGL